MCVRVFFVQYNNNNCSSNRSSRVIVIEVVVVEQPRGSNSVFYLTGILTVIG